MSRTVEAIAADLTRAQEAVEAVEAKYGTAARGVSDSGVRLADAVNARDRLRRELREAVAEAGDHWPDPGRDCSGCTGERGIHLATCPYMQRRAP